MTFMVLGTSYEVGWWWAPPLGHILHGSDEGRQRNLCLKVVGLLVALTTNIRWLWSSGIIFTVVCKWAAVPLAIENDCLRTTMWRQWSLHIGVFLAILLHNRKHCSRKCCFLLTLKTILHERGKFFLGHWKFLGPFLFLLDSFYFWNQQLILK